MYNFTTTKRFDKQYKKISKSKDIVLVDEVISKLLNGKKLERKYSDHLLKGNYKGYRECHIKPDLLLIYKKQNDILILTCVALGTHSKLLGM